ncbi:hypothetical protein [Alicyclobacillus suci]|uniref:hypothetical protein n=1 Tax=Alicyclobacillus suci TaxID=2816080 RepID=UPI0011BF588E|nr:hypothetical protein [Alicyclobacillus suci]
MEQSAAQTSALSGNIDHEKLIHTVTQGGEFLAEPGVTTLWLIPQISYRPFTIRNHWPGCAVYYYPVDPNVQTDLDKNRLISNIAAKHKAVGDGQRVRLLELLAASSKSLAELAQAIGASKPRKRRHKGGEWHPTVHLAKSRLRFVTRRQNRFPTRHRRYHLCHPVDSP